MCLIEPLYSISLRQLLRNTGNRGISFRLIFKIAKQLIGTLAFLQIPEIEIVHFDLKPENILLENPKRLKLRVIDFGAAKKTKDLEECNDYLVSRFYRAPEICLSLPYTHAVDVWSVACILVELATSEPLFPAKDGLSNNFSVKSEIFFS
jgi:serine/threonine protein kinase